ncbi:MAG: hypothetical protein JWN36_2366 [Microbacteriaceae bacterium]|jgi:hypothetical protein|nr:hypothetical protein [Microbacteriaceae bacterium]
MTITSEERLFALLIDEAEFAMPLLGNCREREELCAAVVGLERRLSMIRSRDGR